MVAADEVWTGAVQLLRSQISDGVWQSTFANVSPVKTGDGTLVLSVPNAIVREKLDGRYRPLVEKVQSGELFVSKSAKEFPAKSKITQLLGDSGKFDFSPYHTSIDLVFIDGSHDFDYVINDSEIALKLLRNGKGIILWHDYRAGIEVVRAMEAFKQRHPELEIFHVRDTNFAYLKVC